MCNKKIGHIVCLYHIAAIETIKLVGKYYETVINVKTIQIPYI